jgi:polar amino acid transport system substrate-binding protein
MKRIMVLTSAALFVLGSFGVAFSESTLDVVKKRGKVIAGVRNDSPPMGYVDKNNQVVGFEVELVKGIAEKLKVGVELVQVTAKTRIPMLANSNIDMFAASANHTQKRDEVIDYSITYFRTGEKLLVKKDSPIKNWSDLDGKTLAIAQGAATRPIFEKLYKTKTNYLTFQEKPQAVLAVKQGKADAYGSDEVGLMGLAKTDPSIKVVGDYLYKSYFGIGVRENDSKWRDAINFAIVELFKSGEFNKLYKKYFDRDVNFEIEEWAED